MRSSRVQSFADSSISQLLLKELADASRETANLAILRGTKMAIVDAVESLVELHVSPLIGTMDSVTAKSNGKAVVSWLPESRVQSITLSIIGPALRMTKENMRRYGKMCVKLAARLSLRIRYKLFSQMESAERCGREIEQCR